MSGGTHQPHFNYVTNSARSKQRLTLIEYNDEQRVFKALQLRNACEMKMGVRRNDGHYFFPEEVVWMVEAGLAAVLQRGMQLSVQQCYLLLGAFLITPAKFLVYSYLKRAGYVILPHNALQTSVDHADKVNWKCPPKSYFPPNLLDQFPSFKSMTLTLTPLHHNPKIAETFGVPEQFSESSVKAFKLDEQSETRKNSREVLRPRYWPKFDKFASCVSTWSDYRVQRAKVLNRNSSQLVPFSPQLPIDYDVYTGDRTFCRRLSPKPVYRLVVVDMYLPFPSPSSLHWLSSQIPDSRLLIAVVQHAAIVFYNVDHQTVCL